MFNVMTTFTIWLNAQIEEKSWSYSELARRAGMSPSNVSMVMSEQLDPTFEFCSKVARALVLPPSLVMQKAGLLGSPNRSPTFRELMALLEDMTIEEQREILDYALYRRSKREGDRGERPGSETAPVTS
jgi:transcriptional regulator with XRE-family HTH domain